jgi:NADPH:quinone reductase-like Zn-dependent oxidoreductase
MATAAVPRTMTAVGQDRYGSPSDVLRVRQVAVPTLGDGDVLVRVRAAGVNPADVFMTTGRPAMMRLAVGLRRPRAATRGQDLAGTVVAVGANVPTLRPGDAVYGEGDFGKSTGSYAEYVRVPHTVVAPKPGRLSFEQAGALPMVGLTALRALRVADVRPGQRVLVNGASGGVGHAAVQLAVARGAVVTGVCSTRNVAMVQGLGAAHVVDYAREDVTELAERYDVILDNVANLPLRRLRALLTPRGTLLLNSGNGGRVLGPLPRMARGAVLSLVGAHTVRPFTMAPSTADLVALTELVDAGALTPVVERAYPLAETAAAIEHVSGGHVAGKVVVVV